MASDLDDKAKRVRSLLSSYYGTGPAEQGSAGEGRAAPSYVGIDSKGFDADRYVASLLRGTRLEGLLSKHVEMAAEIKNLDSDMQMLVYENYNKFISATDTIRRMKENVGGMESQMDLLLTTVTSVRSKSDGVNTNLSSRRERIESLNGTRSLLRKVQFVFDLPKRLRKCLEHKAYAQAVKYYVGALPILNKYGDSSFQSCKDESEEVMEKVIREMEGLVVSDDADIDDRAEAVQLLEQLNQPVDQLQEDFLARHWKRLLQELQDVTAAKAAADASAEEPATPRTTQLNANRAFIEDFTRTASAFRTLFPQAEAQLTLKTQELYREYFSHVQGALQPATGTPRAADLVAAIKTLSDDTHLMHDVVPDAGLYKKAEEAARRAVEDHVASIFSSLEERILSSALASTSVAEPQAGPATNLSTGLEGATRALLQGSIEVVQDVEGLLDDGVQLLASWQEEYVDLVQSKFQQLFQSLHDTFFSLGGGAEDPGRAPPPSPRPSGSVAAYPGAASSPGLVLLLARLCVAIDTQGLPRVTESLARKFAGGSARKDRPSFLPSEFARLFRAAGERLLQQYVNLQIKKLTLLVRKSVETPNWLKAKEPRDVRMVADLLLQEVEAIQSDVRQLLDAGERATHRRTNSGSAVAARSTPPSAEQRRMAPTQRSRSRILERDVAKLFRQKVELFTKIEYTQSSVLSAIVKIVLKSFEELVRLETFSRSGFQQIQLDTQYLRAPLREYMDDETVVDTLLDEVCTAAAERCLDPTPLEPSVIDRIVVAKRSKQGP